MKEGILYIIFYHLAILVVILLGIFLIWASIYSFEIKSWFENILGFLSGVGILFSVIILAYLGLWTNKIDKANNYMVSTIPYLEESKKHGFFYSAILLEFYGLAIMFKNKKFISDKMFPNIEISKLPSNIRNLIIGHVLGGWLFLGCAILFSIIIDTKIPSNKLDKLKPSIQIYNNQFRVTDSGTGKPKVNRRYKITNPKTGEVRLGKTDDDGNTEPFKTNYKVKMKIKLLDRKIINSDKKTE